MATPHDGSRPLDSHRELLVGDGKCAMIQSRMRRWLTDILVGGVVGGVVGAIVAVNFVIYVGIDRGYEASIADVFRQNTLAGSATVAILAAGPVLGVVVARRRRRKRTPSKDDHAS